jgi:hypothetical protein
MAEALIAVDVAKVASAAKFFGRPSAAFRKQLQRTLERKLV